MIGKLFGTVDSYGDDWVILNVSGVGYIVHCSARTLGTLPARSENCELAIETYVREDQIRLFGFAEDVERDWFKLLLTVQGIGTKVALAVLSTLSVNELASAIARQDKAQVSRTPGVGPKVALRLINELKDKSPAISASVVDAFGAGQTVAPTAQADAVSALVNLGYSQTQAGMAVSAAAHGAGEDAQTSELIRLGLKELAQ
jgi:holliday junction DNA helicase RuvA